MPKEYELDEVRKDSDIGVIDTEFLLRLPNGNYLYVSDLQEKGVLTDKDIQKAPYKDLPIYYDNRKGD